MNNERIYQVLQGPVFSEKAQVLGETANLGDTAENAAE